MPFDIQSVCILGRQPALGLAELESLYGAETVIRLAPQVAGLSLHAHDVDFKRLGGSTRLAHVVAELPSTDWKQIERALPNLIVELALTLPPDGKVQLGLSAFGLRVSPSKLNAIGLTLKKVLRSKLNRSVRVTPNPELELNTAQVLHNHLVGSTGVELLLIADKDGKTLVARTTAVQDIDSYTLRDRGRPKRDARVGMLPPKLAQIIINLAEAETRDTQHATRAVALDPFCGTGVLLQEALLAGFNTYGTDLEPRMVEYSRANLEWAVREFDIRDLNFDLEQGDATTHRWHSPIDFVAAETYLGRPFTTPPRSEVLAQTMSEVNLILKKFLKNIHGQLKPGTRLCLAVPAWNANPDSRISNSGSFAVKNSRIENRFKHLPLIDQMSNLGYNRVSFEHVRDEQLLYYREDQIVARQLLVLTRK